MQFCIFFFSSQSSFFLLEMIKIASILWVLFHCAASLCFSLNDEGLALLSLKQRVTRDPSNALFNWNCTDLDHCSWFGVQCSDGKVVILELRDLGLEGTFPPELGNLTQVKQIILRNNSFSGLIPEEIGQLKQLEVLDLGCNNFSGQFPLDHANNLSLSILLLDNNKLMSSLSPEIYNLMMLSEYQVGDDHLGSTASRINCDRSFVSWDAAEHVDLPKRKLLQFFTEIKLSNKRKKSTPLSPSPSPSPSPEQEPSSPPFSPPSDAPSPSLPQLFTPLMSSELAPNTPLQPEESSSPYVPPSSTVSFVKDSAKSRKKNNTVYIVTGTVGGSVLVFGLVLFVLCRRNKVVTVGPWVTGLSGQLQKAFVTGVPKLKRSELVTACEDFSNIIGSLSDGTVYKGTLSSGVEIAVTSKAMKSAKEWPNDLESQFRNKIDTLSKVNHKNFVNLIGFCEEENPFTRMMVFEYAPNGSLFEHLHVKESEHLDWKTRLRIVMGIAYCLEYMHQLNPPIAHGDLQTASVYLTEDYAAKISDFRLWNEVMAAKMGSSASIKHSETSSADPEGDVYSFGFILLEIITGILPYSLSNESLVEWALDQLRKGKPLKELVDPTLASFKEEELEKLLALITQCLLRHPCQRPTMREITTKLKEITAFGPDGANPKTSPLWWAELEIVSTATA